MTDAGEILPPSAGSWAARLSPDRSAACSCCASWSSKPSQAQAGSVKEAIIAIEVFGRKSYDPKIDATVRVEIARLRSALAKYYATDGVDDPIEIAIPKGSYAPLFRSRERTAVIPVAYQESAAEEMATKPSFGTPASNPRRRLTPVIAWTTGALALLILIALAVTLASRGKNREGPRFVPFGKRGGQRSVS